MSNNKDKIQDERDKKGHKSPKSVTFSSKLGYGITVEMPSGNNSVATSNSNRQRHHSHSHGHHSSPHNSNGNRQRNLSYTSSEETETEESPEDSTTTSPEDSSNYHILELPENVIESVFAFLPLPDLRKASMVCSEWLRIVNDENNEVWRSHCFSKLHQDALQSRLLTDLPTFKSKLRAFYHAWNPHDCSRNIYVKPNGFTIHRNPVAQSTDGVRGKIGFTHGRHAWEVVWEGPLGTVAVVGVATRRAEMRAQGYVPLLGQDDQSWGWNLVENCLLHNGDSQGNYPLINNAPRYQVGEKIRVILDCEDNTLSFEKDYEFYGVAFRGLPGTEPLYPAISAVYGNTEVSMIYIGPPVDG